ncbi:DUF3599 family protein [Desulforamulus aquiferis]|uniref:DUF3599 family protein n=1 Tax=Desulforamulus aquiferis TaxID=1397668 RepID=A0AAW7ZC81_9FIRM|nr:DUF3599 family protein [Desulforamulus aquiferis]MDO7787130.1 DUF3599 family protein [Desulforamulus aquiferis]
MSYAKLLTDRCDIFHLVATSDPVEFGVPFAKTLGYPEEANLTDVPCYFSNDRKGQVITQGEPNNRIVESFLVHFKTGTDVRINDKVIFQGDKYCLQKPRDIRGHHIEVKAVRDEDL